MPFGTFTREMVVGGLGLTYSEGPLFAGVPPFPVPDGVRLAMKPGVELATALDNEKSKSEFIIAPALLHARELLGRSFGLFSGVELIADRSRELTGFCDFVITKSPAQLVMEAPVLAIVEAKNDNIHNGLWQAVASAYGARVFNENSKRPSPVTYGAVTTGLLWQFLKIEGSTVQLDDTRYTLDELDKVFGILKYIIETA
jgi:hypothetical protein